MLHETFVQPHVIVAQARRLHHCGALAAAAVGGRHGGGKRGEKVLGAAAWKQALGAALRVAHVLLADGAQAGRARRAHCGGRVGRARGRRLEGRVERVEGVGDERRVLVLAIVCHRRHEEDRRERLLRSRGEAAHVKVRRRDNFANRVDARADERRVCVLGSSAHQAGRGRVRVDVERAVGERRVGVDGRTEERPLDELGCELH
mmetsp:Transcript_4037/g.10275  ORF Transcript_4037/g.10275 Transcript_4037/m.10275 type:complete len:204 (+) Transcript_4037:522-1133(+)